MESAELGGAEEQDLLPRLEEYSGDVSVDCTLTLGPSSRGGVVAFPAEAGGLRASPSTSSWFVGVASAQKESGRAASSSSTGKVRRCATCATTQTPLWRNGPNGAKTLCNACGIRFKKEERRTNLGTDSRGMTRSSKKPKVHV
ncbi:GATA transcription factor 20-like [Nymphaea colorata]|nr:GATA transcription factor 20-like [Nymphaea colorata]